jgi:hypothetical protein
MFCCAVLMSMAALAKSSLRRTHVQNSTLAVTRSPCDSFGLNCETSKTAPSNNLPIKLRLCDLNADFRGDTGDAEAWAGSSCCMRRSNGRSFL